MSCGRNLVAVVILSVGNGILLGAALRTARPGCYVAAAMGAGTFLNLAYLVAGRLWQQRP